MKDDRSMTKTMTAAVADRPGEPLTLRELPLPEPSPGQVLVHMAATGVCHTDISLIDSDWPMKKPQFPFVPGHEGCGHVAGLGGGVKGVKEGDRVGVFWLNGACGKCDYCVSGREPLCLAQAGTGYTTGGTYAEYCVVSETFAIPLPKGDLEEFAPIMCAGVTTYKGLKELRGSPGNWVVIVGVGGTGHLAIQYAKAMGLNVAAVDIGDDQVALAQELGATIAINAERQFPVNKIVSLTGGAHGVVVTANSAKAYDQAVRMLRRGGTCIVIGISSEPITLNPFDLVIKGLTVRGSLIGTRQDLREALELVSDGRVRPRIEIRPLADVNSAISAMRSRQIKGRTVLRIT
jgi:propanol-preferring alcohol dehydrogenase